MFPAWVKLALRCLPALAGPLLAAGCAASPPPPVLLDTAGVKPGVDYQPLGRVLAAVVGHNGLARPDDLKRHADDLKEQLKLLAVTGPTATPTLLPTSDGALAYWYNAHAAWSLELLLLADCPKEIAPAAILRRPFPLDGRTMTLEAIEAILAGDADFRTVVAVPGATLQDAALPTQPIGPTDIRRQIAERFDAFLGDSKRFVIDVAEQEVQVPAALWQFQQGLRNAHDARYHLTGTTLATALLPYATGPAQRRLQDALGYRAVVARPSMLVAVPETG
jgi:hypothetical protein